MTFLGTAGCSDWPERPRPVSGDALTHARAALTPGKTSGIRSLFDLAIDLMIPADPGT